MGAGKAFREPVDEFGLTSRSRGRETSMLCARTETGSSDYEHAWFYLVFTP